MRCPQERYFLIVDVVQVLSEQPDVDGARNYWKVLKKRLKDEGCQLVTNCNQLKIKHSKEFSSIILPIIIILFT